MPFTVSFLPLPIIQVCTTGKPCILALYKISKAESNDSTCTIDDGLIGRHLPVKNNREPFKKSNNEKIEYNAESYFGHGNHWDFNRALWKIQWVGI